MNAALHAPEGPRWGRSLCIVLGVHALAVGGAVICSSWSPVPAPPSPPQAVMVELAPLPSAPPAPPTDLAPGPLQQEQQPQPAQAAATPAAAVTPPSVTLPADAALPPPAPERQEQRTVSIETAEVLQSTAPPSVQAPSSTRYTARQSSAGAAVPSQANWQALVLAHLERYKRYPRAAQRRRSEGVSLVEYAVDRSGGVQWARLARSSGNALLDGEALAAVQRASPLPSPPDEVQGDPVQITTPVEFFIR